ncbi:HalX domain-containing protein [Haloparvum sp. PAK95]|uniref:HalX domain-containing protein n=1 Tax=Haloparvum sp. PAK95 TaxID=3418962 RepID=UPI003D2EE0CD
MSDTEVLVVEDETELADLYVGYLEPKYDVRTAGTVDAALSEIDGSLDAVLLDRRLPDGSGDEVLETIRSEDVDCRVAMVTAVEPGFDIIEMGFDLYLTKPANRDRVREAVETLKTRSEYDEMLQQAAALATKRAVLESWKSATELAESDEYERLLDRLDDVDANLTQVTNDFSPDDYRAMFRDLGRS